MTGNESTTRSRDSIDACDDFSNDILDAFDSIVGQNQQKQQE